MKEQPQTPKPNLNPGLAKIRGLKIQQGKSGLEDDPEISAAISEDAKAMHTFDTDTDVDATMEEALESTAEAAGKTYPIGNGKTLPFPDEGEDVVDYATCRKPQRDVNRGCRFYGTLCRLPMLAKKHNQPGGPYNVRYKDLRTGVVKTCFCTTLASTYLKVPHIVLIPPSESDPPGETWVPTLDAQRTPLANGQMPVPGPGQPTTPIKMTPRRTRVICHPSPEVTREYQLMRRRGDFDQPAQRPKRRRAG